MRDNRQCASNGAAKRCFICGGKFGLVRHYSWRTALCSKKCADQFRTRQVGDRRWLAQPRAASQRLQRPPRGISQSAVLRNKEVAQCPFYANTSG
jgi:hypothetical protein